MNRRNLPTLRQAAALLGAGVVAIVAACGGGGGDTTTAVAPPAATSYAQGPITGFGSVIVNGVRWDDSGASVADDDGVAHPSGDLKLGMVVQVDGMGVDHGAGTGKALAFRFGSETLGPISSIDAAASTMVVLGLTVEVTTSTVFDTSISGGLAGLATGDVVEVYGLFDAANDRVVATRVELEAGASAYRLRGTVASLDTTAKTFMLGSELVSYDGLSGVPSVLANGIQVKVRLQTAQNDAGAWVATRLRIVGQSLPANRPDAEVEGVISAWTSATDFEINGLKVDATNAAFADGSDGVVLGAHVEVRGAVVDGVLVATSVSVDDDGHHGGVPRMFELHGLVGNLDTTAMTFALRGLTVSWAGDVSFSGGTADNLADGVRVEVRGTLSADLTRIDATRISFEH